MTSSMVLSATTPKVNVEPNIYWLHVDENGAELRFADPPPGVPCKLVEVVGDSEETSTQGEWMPPGRGWRYRGYDDCDRTLWWRPVP